MKLKNTIISYAQIFIEHNLCGQSGFVCYRIDKQHAYYFSGDFAEISEQQIKKINYLQNDLLVAKILRQNKSTNVIVHIAPKKIMVVSKGSTDIPPILDDMAQIIGVKVEVVPDKDSNILKAIKKSTSVIVANKGAIVTGRSLNETLTCCLVLEKTAAVHIASFIMGGSIYNGYLPSKLMRLVYKLKYSKKNQQKMQAEEK